MFDLGQVFELMRIEPGLQTVLLFMIWWQSRGLRKDVASLHEYFNQASSVTDTKFKEINLRLILLEEKKHG